MPLVLPGRRTSSRGSYSEGCAADVAWRIRSDFAPLSSLACADFLTSIPSCQGFPTLGTNSNLLDHSGHFPERTHDREAGPGERVPTSLDATLRQMLTLPR